MARLRTQAAKDNLLRRVRKQRLKYITVLPSLITIINGVCGFIAIIFASNNEFAKAGYMLVFAMIADVLDGRVARMSQNTSSFGGQLDSLCDIISFGVAPAFLMIRVVEHKFAGFVGLNPALGNFFQRFIWLAAAVYLSCAAIRLARFNVENEEDESAHMSFIGLPTPAAAGAVFSLVVFRQETVSLLSAQNDWIYKICDNVIIYSLPFIVLAVAVLMVSRIRYQHVLNQYLKGKKPFSDLIKILLVLGLLFWNLPTALAFLFCSFAASGFINWLYRNVIRKKNDLPLTNQPPIPDGF